MILSHRYRFIFLKTNKTAGTSIEIALSRFCGPDDIITPISAADEELRRRAGGRGPQNFKVNGSPRYYNHMTAAELRERVSPEIWSSYFKFCVERNPWDRAISSYYHVYSDEKYESEPRPSLGDFIRSGGLNILKEKGFRSYTIDGAVAVDQVVRFESLDDELELIRKRLGIPEPLQLPRAKGAFRKDRRPYSQVFSPEDRKIVEELFADEIRLMGYRF